MKKFFLFCLFLIGLGWAVSNFSGLATQGSYDSIVLDFRESLGQEEIANQVRSISEKYQIVPYLNSEFSQADNIYVVRGDAKLLKSLRKSLGKQTEFIEPNYIYRVDEIPGANSQAAIIYEMANSVPNDPLYGQQWNFRSINLEGAWSET
ncbi:MAG TPA: peptidase S8, partial [Oscillatoriales bacterium UBA8482]|nr:peptidase S8 [Oscillatoriales bacterium UBA8482]